MLIYTEGIVTQGRGIWYRYTGTTVHISAIFIYAYTAYGKMYVRVHIFSVLMPVLVQIQIS